MWLLLQPPNTQGRTERQMSRPAKAPRVEAAAPEPPAPPQRLGGMHPSVRALKETGLNVLLELHNVLEGDEDAQVEGAHNKLKAAAEACKLALRAPVVPPTEQSLGELKQLAANAKAENKKLEGLLGDLRALDFLASRCSNTN